VTTINRALRSGTQVPVVPILLVAFIIFAATTDGFFSAVGVQSILRDSAVLMIAATGATLVFLIGGIDLTVGSTIACAGVASAAAMHATQSIAAGVVVGLGVGVVIGLVNGWFIGYWGLSPFIFTLAMLLVVRAAGYLFAAAFGGSTASSIGGLPSAVFRLGRGVTLGLPNVFYVALAVMAVAVVVLRSTMFGRRVYLMGDSEISARFNGVDVRRVKFAVYFTAAVISSLAGVILTIRVGSGSPAAGDALLLSVIAATVIGGTSLLGGSGGVVRSVFGAVLIAMVTIGLDLAGYEFWDQAVVLGLIILVGATLSSRFSIAGRLLK
jgi:ribose/xylose/arabinose/galactoside ABC-type transport system permease subunit